MRDHNSHLHEVLVIVGVRVAAKFGPVNGESEQPHISRQLDLG